MSGRVEVEPFGGFEHKHASDCCSTVRWLGGPFAVGPSRQRRRLPRRGRNGRGSGSLAPRKRWNSTPRPSTSTATSLEQRRIPTPPLELGGTATVQVSPAVSPDHSGLPQTSVGALLPKRARSPSPCPSRRASGQRPLLPGDGAPLGRRGGPGPAAARDGAIPDAPAS